MSSISAIFGNTQPDDTDESDKLKELYWNRAELKKEYASLREENLRLQQLLQEKEGSTARVLQRLQHLEGLLLDEDWVYNAVVYYQLRALNQRCKGKLARFAEQLKQQREKRQQTQILDEWSGEQQSAAEALRGQIGEHRMHIQMLEDQLQAERHRLSTMGGFSKLFKRRALDAQIENVEIQLAEANMRESEMLRELSGIEDREAPDSAGLDIPTKRSINFMILSFAQQMYLHFLEDDLSGMAKESGDKSVGAVKYGSKADCDAILERVRQRGKSLENLTDFVEVLQHRAKLLAEKALFNDDNDAVPVPGTVATVYIIGANGKVREKDANLLGENYWDIATALSR